MIIKNLGPIKEIEISLTKLNIFVGENGVGKTIAAYAIFSFVNWYERHYVAKILSVEQVTELSENGIVEISKSSLEKELINKAVIEFNSLSSGYFKRFFRNKGIYNDDSKILINKNDVEVIVSHFINGKGGRSLGWPYKGEEQNESNRTNEFNHIKLMFTDDSVKVSVKIPHLVDVVSIEKSREQQLLNLTSNKLIRLNRILKILYSVNRAYLPAERIGIDVFRTDINLKRLNDSSGLVMYGEEEQEFKTKRYPEPIESYIRFLNNTLSWYDNERRIDSRKNSIRKTMKKIVPGKFRYQSEFDTIEYILPNSDEKIDFELLSSSLKSNLGLELFISRCRPNDWLFIDEPEMNLHPINQVGMADLQYDLMKYGVIQVVSTHSDYYLKALVNDVLADKLDHQTDYSTWIAVYLFSEDGISKIDKIFNDSINDSFDDVTNNVNDTYFDLMEKLEDGDN